MTPHLNATGCRCTVAKREGAKNPICSKTESKDVDVEVVAGREMCQPFFGETGVCILSQTCN